MDLASFFSESIEAARSHHDRAKMGQSVPAVPDCDELSGNDQAIENKSSSRSSRSSRPEISDEYAESEQVTQAGAGARAGVRVRGWIADGREQRERREQPAGSDTYSSRSLSSKRELERKTGTDALPAAPAAPLPDFEERAAVLEYDCGLTRLAAEAQARRECQEAASASAIARPSVAALPREDGLTLWRAGIVALGLSTAPCPGYRGDEWTRTRTRALDFLGTFGAQAEALGWTASRLFGVHPAAGIVRVDACGGLVLPGGGAVRAITATEISFGHLTHREKPDQPQGVPIWEFGR